MLIDTHCHLASFHERGDVAGTLARAERAGVGRVITIGTGPEDWELYAMLAGMHPDHVDYTIGLHPCDVPEDESWPGLVEKIPPYFQRARGAGPKPVALGEIGLDRFHLPKDPEKAAAQFARQEAAFRAQLAMARELGCAMVIHSRDAFPDCVRILDESGVDWRRVVFHCFAHGAAEIRELNQRGGRGSFTGIITYKSAAPAREALAAQGMGRLMIETDAPYLAPVPHRGQPNEPAYVEHTAREAARVLNLPFAELAAQTAANARAFFGLV
ncbi:MAG TPA: TatD family hydrolase [Opitutales bacterium]|nr:TatD family hydrolase [Opitutales bacterium]